MTDPTGMSPFGGSGFRTSKARSSERRCWGCKKPMDTSTKLVRCGHCHDQRMAEVRERRASLSQGPAHTDGCPPTTTTTKEPRP